MAEKEITILLSEELVEALGAAARDDGVSVTDVVADAVEAELRRRDRRRRAADWQAKYGAFTIDELAAARSAVGPDPHQPEP